MSQKYTNLSSLFTDIANAIREKKGTNESIIADDFPDEIGSIENGGDIINFEKKFIKRTIQLSIYENSYATAIGNGVFYFYSSLTSVSFPQVTTIGRYAFAYCSSLTSVSFPQATSIGDTAFYACTSLTSVNFPRATIIGNNAFQNCYSLTSVNFPQAINIGSYAFQDCSSLTSVSFPQIITIGSYAFSNCHSLTSAIFPQVTTIGSYAFYDCRSLTSAIFPQVTTIENCVFRKCSSLTSVSFPQVTSIGSSVFTYCSSLTLVYFPQAINIGNQAFRECTSLTLVSFPQVTNIGSSVFYYCRSLTSAILGGQQSQLGRVCSYAFYGCYSLTDLHLQGSYLYSLSNSNAFSSTPIAGYSASAGKLGSIYVPASLYSRYISATNWAYFSSRFVSVSQSSGGNDSGGNNNNYGFTIDGEALTITDNSKLTDGLLNTDDYLIVGVGLDEDTYTEFSMVIWQNMSEYDYSIDFRTFNSILKQNGIYNGGLSICLIDNNNNTYHCLLDESLFQYIVFARYANGAATGYIPVIHKNMIDNDLSLPIINDLNFYMLGYIADYYYTLQEFSSIDEFGANGDAAFEDWRETSMEAIESITDDMFKYPPQE